ARQRNSKEVEHMRTDKIRRNHQHQAVHGNPPSQRSSRLRRVLLGHGEKYRTSGKRVNNGEQCTYCEQENFDGIGHLFLLQLTARKGLKPRHRQGATIPESEYRPVLNSLECFLCAFARFVAPYPIQVRYPPPLPSL